VGEIEPFPRREALGTQLNLGGLFAGRVQPCRGRASRFGIDVQASVVNKRESALSRSRFGCAPQGGPDPEARALTKRSK
jgi:hypothetical protein